MPATATSPTLTYWIRIDTAETGSTAYDTAAVKINGTTKQSYSNASTPQATWVQKTIDLTAYKGTTVTLELSAVEDQTLQTSLRHRRRGDQASEPDPDPAHGPRPSEGRAPSSSVGEQQVAHRLQEDRLEALHDRRGHHVQRCPRLGRRFPGCLPGGTVGPLGVAVEQPVRAAVQP
nr:hypothetical protein [Nocardioides convexus]